MIRYVILLALLIRIAAAFQWQHQVNQEAKIFRFGDSESYWVLASKIADGQPYDYAGETSRIFRAPLYPLFLAAATYLDDRTGVMLARLMGAFVGSLTVGLIAIAAQRLAGKTAGLCAGVLAAFYPGAIGMSIFILSEAIFCPLMLLSIIAWNGRKDRWWYGGLSGIACGLACLARPSLFLWPIFLAILSYGYALRASFLLSPPKATSGSENSWLSRFDSGGVSNRFIASSLSLLAFAIGMVIIMSPWWYRNYTITQRFVPTTLQVGASLYDGWHAGASGGSDEGMAFVVPFAEQLRREEQESENDSNASKANSLNDTFEWRLNDRLFKAALNWANQNRSDACQLALIKFKKMWNPWPTAKEVGGMGVRISESVAYVVIVVCACVGLCIAREQNETKWSYALPIFYFAALHLVFASSVRYRQPAILVLCVVAGIGAAWMLEQIANQRTRSRA
jgi:Dolichyl-phosphate-mannose-protein mannosyltransferase